MIFIHKFENLFLNKNYFYGDWGLGIGDWAQSPIPNPQSPIPNPQSPIFLLLKY
jgi:hypothetical protein